MLKKYFLIACFVVPPCLAMAQDAKSDSLSLAVSDNLAIDTSIDYDDLLNELDLFFDSILAPRSYFVVSLSAGQGYFNFNSRSSLRTRLLKKLIWSPVFGYYDKHGFGFTMTGYILKDSVKPNLYQVSFTPSYDYLKDRNLGAGISFTKYFTKNSVPFYTSPLQSELNAYFLWRKPWLQPGIMANYGWGSRTEYNKRDTIYRKIVATALANSTIRVSDTVSILRENRESIVDFSIAATLRHDFYWLNIFSKKDHIRFSPLLSLSAGTQRFGFNQTTGAYGSIRAAALNNTRSLSLKQKFLFLSMTLYLRSEYSIGKFFIQPQVLFDYYFPGESNKFATTFSINAGFIF